MAMKTPQQIAANWASKMAGASQNTTNGVNAVQTAPGQQAAAQVNAYTAGVQNNSSKWAKNVAGVSLQSWQSSMITKGIPRMASGAAAATSKVANFQSQLQPYIQSAVASLPARGPKGTNQARMTQFSTAMSNFKYNKSAS